MEVSLFYSIIYYYILLEWTDKVNAIRVDNAKGASAREFLFSDSNMAITKKVKFLACEAYILGVRSDIKTRRSRKSPFMAPRNSGPISGE